jgi:hypothetical protein
MITDNGKSIIGKYLLGQAPAYASYIAIGCGAQPLETVDPYGDYALKNNLDFEMFRVPISSRGFVNEGGTEKLVLTAELPTEERYEITEIGLYSAGSNPSAGAYDSKTVFAFTQGENWQYHTNVAATSIPTITEPLDDPLDNNIIATSDPVFQTNADNSIFYKAPRPERYERSRFLNNIILIQGDDSDLTLDASTGSSAGHFVIESGSNHIHLTGADVNFSRNSPIDELRLAFSVVNKNPLPEYFPEAVKILIEFSSSPTYGSGEWARMKIDISDYDFLNNRYIVSSTQLQDLEKSSAGFSWSSVNTIKIYSSVITEIGTSEDYFVCLDALKLENKNQSNPLYGLVGYTRISNDQKLTVVKSANKTSYIEFRFGLDVGNG